MKILIPRIPDQVTRAELWHFVKDGVDALFLLPFFQRPKIASCDILEITDRNGISDHHGLVVVVPDRLAHRLIEHITGERLHGKRVYARQFIERRSPGSVGLDEERRRSHLTITKLRQPMVKGYSLLAHTHAAE